VQKCGRAFQAGAASTVNVRSPSDEQRVMVGTISCDVGVERRCRRVVTSDTRWKLLARYSGAVPYRQRYASTQCSWEHAINKAGQAAEWHGHVDVPRGWDDPRHWWLPAVCRFM